MNFKVTHIVIEEIFPYTDNGEKEIQKIRPEIKFVSVDNFQHGDSILVRRQIRLWTRMQNGGLKKY